MTSTHTDTRGGERHTQPQGRTAVCRERWPAKEQNDRGERTVLTACDRRHSKRKNGRLDGGPSLRGSSIAPWIDRDREAHSCGSKALESTAPTQLAHPGSEEGEGNRNALSYHWSLAPARKHRVREGRPVVDGTNLHPFDRPTDHPPSRSFNTPRPCYAMWAAPAAGCWLSHGSRAHLPDTTIRGEITG